jgi:hypothetical protein
MRTFTGGAAIAILSGALALGPGLAATAAAAPGTAAASARPASAAPDRPANPQVPGATARPCGWLSRPRGYIHVVWIWMENHSYSKIIGSRQAPYINRLAGACGLATNYHNISHPSLPNYIGATSGLGYAALRKFKPDCNPAGGCTTTSRSIFSQGVAWRAYQQSMPSNCDRTNAGVYVVHHNPPPYYHGLPCSSHDVPFTRLAIDISTHHMPAFAFITPNVIDDMHRGSVPAGDAWLAATLPVILRSQQYRSGSVIVFITWDEGEGGTVKTCATNTTDVGCHVATIVVSPSTRRGTRSGQLFNHYSLLGTTELLLHRHRLGLARSYANMISAFHL